MADAPSDSALLRAISTDTLPNSAALAHLLSRKHAFENENSSDAPLTAGQRARILHIFDDAVHVQAKKAKEENASVCRVLKKALTEVARVIFEAERERDRETERKMKMKMKDGGEATAMKRGGGKSGAGTSGVTRKEQRGALQRQAVGADADAKKALPAVPTAPSPSMKRKPPSVETKKPASRKRRQLKAPPKSNAYVEDSSSATDRDDAGPLKRSASRGRTGSKTKLAAHTAEANGKQSLIVKLRVRIPSYLLSDCPAPNLRGAANNPKPRSSITPTNNPPNTHVPIPSPSDPPISDDSDPAWESDTSPESPCRPPPTLPAPTFLTQHAFPPYPPLSARDLAPFSKGVDIALTNLTDDAQANPDLTLLELVQELEDNKPTLQVRRNEHDDRKSVLEGGEYVYAAVKQFCEDADKDKKDRGGNGGGEQRLDVGEVTRAFLDHVQREHEMAERRLGLKP